jgi:hypothetical protein
VAGDSGGFEGAFNKLLEEIEALKLRVDEQDAAAGPREIKIAELESWVLRSRPESFDDVDDDWIKLWTPFTSKVCACAKHTTHTHVRTHAHTNTNTNTNTHTNTNTNKNTNTHSHTHTHTGGNHGLL